MSEEYLLTEDLELYVLDMLSEKEQKAIEAKLQSSPKLRAEKERIEQTFELMAELGRISPPIGLKKEILQSILPLSEQKSSKNNFSPFLMAASISLAIVSSSLALWFWTQWQSAEQKLEVALLENTQMADNSQFTHQKLVLTEQSLAIASNPIFKRIELAGTANAPDFKTVVYWNATTKETFLQVSQLGELPESQQYQLWSIQDGQPVDAGVFELTKDLALIKMKDNQQPQAFAITIEPKGGSKSPTLDQMVVLGTV